jgi:uncharacterized membrane protein
MPDQATTPDSKPTADRPRPLAPGDDAWLLRLYASLSSDSMQWRRRIDVTSNWAIPLVIALATFALGEPRLPHFALLALGGGMLTLAAVTDARRYREAHHSAWRMRLVDVGYFAPLLEQLAPMPHWRDHLAADLRRPTPLLDLWTSMKARIRTTYLALLYVLVAAWIVKVLVHPRLGATAAEVLARMRIGALPGEAVATLVGAGVVAMSLIVLGSRSPAHLEDWGDMRADVRRPPRVASPRSEPSAEVT